MPDDADLAEIRRRLRSEILARAQTGPEARPLTASDFDGYLAENDVVMVDFWAAWCGPCRITGPLVERLASKWRGRVAVGKVDVDAQPTLAERFRVQSIPTFLFFRRGQLAGRLVGAQPEAEFERVASDLASG